MAGYMSELLNDVNYILAFRSQPMLTSEELIVVNELYNIATPRPNDKTLALYIRLRRIERRNEPVRPVGWDKVDTSV